MNMAITNCWLLHFQGESATRGTDTGRERGHVSRAGVPVYQAALLPSSHCRASVVLPYPAGATSILILP